MKKPPRRAVFLFGPALREDQSRVTCSARRVKVCSSMATWERKSASVLNVKEKKYSQKCIGFRRKA